MNRISVLHGLVAALCLALWAVPLDAQDSVTVGVGGELSAPLYQELEVPIFADLRKAGTEKLGSYTVRVTWNPTILVFQGWGIGSFGEPVVRQDSTSYGVLWASGVSPQGAAGVVSLLTLTLVPYGTQPDTVRVQVTELSAAGTFRDLLATTTLVLKPGAYCVARGHWGDLDADGLANSRDALAILSSIVGLPVGGSFDLSLGDVDGDALANSRDALILLSYAVGLPIPGQRVLLLAGGACTTGQVPQITILPDTADLVVNQSIDIVGLARDASGAPVIITGGSITSADPRVAVAVDGTITGREPGTTTVTGALGPGVQVSIPVVVRAKRGVWHVDAARGKLAAVQLGTQRWPFATPEYAFPLVSEGDTIRVAPGIVDFEGICSGGVCYYSTPPINAGIVVTGDTLPDGTRPILRTAEPLYAVGLPWYGGQHGEVKNLVFRGFYQPIYLSGLRTLLVENVGIEEPTTQYGYGIAVEQADTIRVRRSEFLADTSRYQSYYGLYVGTRASYVEVRDSEFRNWGASAIRLGGKWQATIVGNRVVGGYYGMELVSADSLAPVVIDSNAISGTAYAGIYLNNVNGPVTGRKNNIGSNAVYGILNYGNGSRNFTLGRFVGNANRAVYNGSAVMFGATANWWGNAAGPGGVVADSVLGSVDASSPLGTDPYPGDVPALAPRPVAAPGPALPQPSAMMVGPRPAVSAPVAEPRRLQDRRAEDEARSAVDGHRGSAPGGTRTHDLRLRRPTL